MTSQMQISNENVYDIERREKNAITINLSAAWPNHDHIVTFKCGSTPVDNLQLQIAQSHKLITKWLKRQQQH